MTHAASQVINVNRGHWVLAFTNDGKGSKFGMGRQPGSSEKLVEHVVAFSITER